jgi:hypothetical protein
MTWTRENVTFANNCFNTNGRDMTQCPVSLLFQDYIDQQDNTAQARINDGIQAEETLGWFLPGHRGDHDIKFGMQYEYSAAFNTNQGNLNGTFGFSKFNGPFSSANPFSYPDRLTIRVGGPSTFYEKAHYISGFAQDKWRFSRNLTLSLGARYDVEVIPIPETDDPLVEKYPKDTNNIAPRFGVTYDLDGGKSVIRAGAGRFFDKTHFEVIGGLYTGTPFTTSFVTNFPVSGADPGPATGQLPTDPLLVNGPTLDRALVESKFPPGARLRNTGATWDNPDRRTPYTDELTVGFERQLFPDVAVSADYVHSQGRDMLMQLQLNPQLRSSTTVKGSTLQRIGSTTLTQATAELQSIYPGFVPFSAGVTQFLNVGRLDYNAVMLQLKKRFSHNYSTQVSYTYGNSHGNTSGNGAPVSNYQVRDDLHLELNEGPTDFDIHHNFTLSGTALVPKTHGLNVSWVARALSGTPFTLIDGNVDPDLNGILAEPLPAGTYSGSGTNSYTVDNYKAQRNGARGPGFFGLDTGLGYAIHLSGRRQLQVRADIFNVTNRTNFGNPGRDQSSTTSFLILNGYNSSYTPRKVQVGARIEF